MPGSARASRFAGFAAQAVRAHRPAGGGGEVEGAGGRTPVVALLAVTLLAFGLRLYYLTDANVWYDEGLSVWAARQPIVDMARWTATDVHPPLYFALLHFWLRCAGESTFAIRYLSVAFGTLAVVALWRVGREILPRYPWIAVAAAALLALSRFAIWWSRETRMYMLAALMGVLSLAFTVRLRWRPRWWVALGYVIVTAAALWSLYLLAFLLVIEGIYWLWTLPAWPTWRARLGSLALWAGLQAVVLAEFAPWLAYTVPRMQHWSGQAAVTASAYVQYWATLLTLGQPDHLESVRVPVLIIVGILVAGTAVLLWQRPWRRQGDLLLLLLLWLAPPTILWLVMMVPRSFGYIPGLEARYVFPYAPLFYLPVACAAYGLAFPLAYLRRPAILLKLNQKLPVMRGVPLLLVAALQIGSLGGYYAGNVPGDDYQSVALTLRAYARPGDGVVLNNDAAWPQFGYYWPQPFVRIPNAPDADPAYVDATLQPAWSGSDAIWLVENEYALGKDPRRLYEGWLAGRAVASHEWRFGSKQLILYARTPDRAASLLALRPGFVPPAPPHELAGDGLTLVGWEPAVDRIQAGGVMGVAAYVERAGVGGDLTVSLGQPALAQARAEVPPGTGVVRLPLSFLIPGSTGAGSQTWYLQLGAGRPAAMGRISLMGAPAVEMAATAPQQPLDFSFGDPPLARLSGCTLDGPATPGSTLTVTLYWTVLQPFQDSYKVFVHVVRGDGSLATQKDDFPGGGQRPTTSWEPGEVIADPYPVDLTAGMAPGTYLIQAGLYDPVTGQRLGPVRSAGGSQPDDQALLGKVVIP